MGSICSRYMCCQGQWWLLPGFAIAHDRRAASASSIKPPDTHMKGPYWLLAPWCTLKAVSTWNTAQCKGNLFLCAFICVSLCSPSLFFFLSTFQTNKVNTFLKIVLQTVYFFYLLNYLSEGKDTALSEQVPALSCWLSDVLDYLREYSFLSLKGWRLLPFHVTSNVFI